MLVNYRAVQVFNDTAPYTIQQDSDSVIQKAARYTVCRPARSSPRGVIAIADDLLLRQRHVRQPSTRIPVVPRCAIAVGLSCRLTFRTKGVAYVIELRN